MPLYKKCQFKPMAWAPPHTQALVISIETESGFIAEDHTPPFVALQLPEVSKNPIGTAYDVESVIGVLMVVGSLYLRVGQLSPNDFPGYHRMSGRW
ncbi:hypothetical protein TNCV_1718671 [Trichonephila clavipes]|nr:hypothetical protein TNCV_1718671 [Trichonephila clavipes]